MRITLINCDVKLKAMGIDMVEVGAYDRLCTELAIRLQYLGVEYNFPPIDNLLIDLEEGTEIPDLSDFGDVVE